jgi:D-glycero-alpha-D-manno-heptose-7-phosphate kinase
MCPSGNQVALFIAVAAYGGITCFEFAPDGRVEAWSLKISEETLYNLEDNLLLFFTGYSRSAFSISM